jgi:hypothetical protein
LRYNTSPVLFDCALLFLLKKKERVHRRPLLSSFEKKSWRHRKGEEKLILSAMLGVYMQQFQQ